MFIVSRMASMVSSVASSGPAIFSSAASSGGGTLDLLSTGLNLASAGATIFGANQKADALQMDAQHRARAALMDSQEQELEARREEVRGKQEANMIMDNLRQTIAAQRVAFAANGLDIGFGTPLSVEDDTRNIANMQLSTARNDGLVKAIARRRQASALIEERNNILRAGKAEAKNTRLAGLVTAGGTVADLLQRRAERG